MSLEHREANRKIRNILKVMWDHIEKVEAHRDLLAEAMAEVKATNDGESDQTITQIVDGCLAELSALAS
jgi:hypothetical protein